MAKKITLLFFCALLFLSISKVSADNFTDLLQDLAVQTACLGMYSTAQTGVYVTSRYNDPPDWYDPPMMANRFASMSGNMTRTITFYGVCFDYAQFAWDDINKYRKIYNDAGMKQWYIASTKPNDPYTIILYDPVTKEKATTISNGVYLKEYFRYNVYAHDGASGHAWIWVQHNNGTWYWIDPTWTDNTGYVWWGIVKDGKEIQYYPDPKYCVRSDYPRPDETPVKKETRSPTYTPSPSNGSSTSSSYFFAGYNYVSSLPVTLPLGISMGGDYCYFSINIGGSDDPYDNTGLVAEWIVGLSFPLYDFLFIPIGIGANHSGPDDNREHKFVIEIGLMPIIFNSLYFSATYRLIDFKKGGFTLGVGYMLK